MIFATHKLAITRSPPYNIIIKIHMSRYLLFCYVSILFVTSVSAQMPSGQFGHEWIRYEQRYLKILVAQDGMYRIPLATLSAQGIDVSVPERLQLFCMGEEAPLYVGNDYIEFFGRRLRSELDQFMYRNGLSDMLNPEYSLITDTLAYFLTVGETLGKRFQNIENQLNNLPPRDEWFWGEDLRVYSNMFVQPVSGDLSESAFLHGSGYAQTRNINQAFQLNFTTPQRFSGIGERDQLDVRLAGIGANPHQISIFINGTTIQQDNFGGTHLIRNYNAMLNTTADSLRIQDATGRIAIATVRLRYPRRFHFENRTNFLFRIVASATDRYIEIENFNQGNVPPILYDLTSGLRLVTTVTDGRIRFKLPPAAQDRELILINDRTGATTLTANVLTPVAFRNRKGVNAEYIILTNKHLRIGELDYIQAYADYRASAAGGGYRTEVIEVDELYDQFAYGMHRHPLAIRNFGHYMEQQWDNPRYVFIIGKGQTFTALRTRNALLQRDTNGVAHVPTFGAPGSDNLLLADNHSQVPRIPIGRLAATTPDEVRMYLQKVRDYENPPSNDAEWRGWRKEVLHLGGGGAASEQNLIRGYLNQMKSTLENSDFGASVTSFFKTSTDPIQQSQTDLLLARINGGVSVMTFFGHSSPSGFDFSLDNPANYQNKGRYMSIFSLGCQTGDYFLFSESNPTSKSIGEQFIFQENRGAIAFIASADRANLVPLNNFQRTYYQLLGGNLYGQGIGDIMAAVIRQLDNFNSLSYRSMLQQFALHADPAIVIMPYGQPDYLIESGSLQFEPSVVNAQQDSFTLQFNVLNIGRAVQDSLSIEISRAFPDGNAFVATNMRIPAPRYREQVTLKLPVLGSRAIGFNKIFIQLNSDGRIEELPIPEARDNNEFRDALGNRGADFFVFSNTIEPVYPLDFGIIGNANDLQLLASTTNSNAPLQGYIMEIDTSATFSSPFKQRQRLEQSGGFLQWRPNILLQDSTVYYWRVSPDSTAAFGYLWSNRSFVYIPNIPAGWHQSHFYQFNQNRLSNLRLPAATRRWNFIENVKTVKVGNTRFDSRGYVPFAEIDGAPYIYQGFSNRITGGLYFFVLNGTTGEPWNNDPPGRYGSQIEWGTTAFPFNTRNREKRAAAIEFLQNIVPAGHYVVLFTLQRNNDTYLPEDWEADTEALGTNLFAVLEAQGARLLRSTATEGARPYIFAYKKDDPSFEPFEILAESVEQILEPEISIVGNWFSGSATTNVIGSVRNWSRLQWQVTPSDEYDRYHVDVYGLRADSSSMLLLPNVTATDTTLSSINAQEFPMLRLRFEAIDETLRTAPQLDYWRVLYEELPDAAIAPNLHLRLPKDTLQQGETARIEVAIANASNMDMDSLLARFRISDERNNVQQQLLRFRPLLRNDTLIARLPIDTRPLQGPQTILIEVNPNNDQPELHRFNNVAFFNFFVEKDRRNPLLEVTFDGLRIMDGDLVSAKPQIVIALEDENRYLPLDNAEFFKLFLESPNPDNPFVPVTTPISLESPQLQFYPARPGEKRNKATIEWTPEFTESGTYALLVQARDATGNAAGTYDLRIRFEVITESQISNVLNYPNPFSTSTRFVYTLTGAEPPAFFKLQIMTVSGRIVRELTEQDLGPLRIGTHQTDFAWDGTDQFGDRLANGVYLYRLIAKDRDGQSLNRYGRSSTDRFFKNDIGKLVILR